MAPPMDMSRVALPRPNPVQIEEEVKIETPVKKPTVIKKTKKKVKKLDPVIDNPNKCDLVNGVVWNDFSCHPKYVATPAQVAPKRVSGSCSSLMAQAGITDTANAYKLIMRESGCNPNAVNPSSGACGMGQQLPCGKWVHTWNDPIGGLIDMQNYVMSRYGSWRNALAWHYSHNWY